MISGLDHIDRKIIEELRRDARIPVANLALRVRLSRHAVRHRINRLEAHKIIAGYTIRLQEPRPWQSTVRAIMMIFRKDRIHGADVTTEIAKIPEVFYCYVLSGESDLIAHIEAESQQRVQDIWSHIASLPGVNDIRTHFTLASIVDRRS